jgi:glycosyltransferase involved in cell wall biosynthesis
MKIVLVTEEFDPAKGYLEYYLAKELVTLGNEVYILTFGSSRGQFKVIEKEGFKVITIPYFVTVLGYHFPNLRGFAYVIKFMKVNKPNVIHCQPLDSPLSLFIAIWKGYFNYRIVGSILTQLNLTFSKWGIKKKFLFSISKILVNKYLAKISEVIFAKTTDLAKLLSICYEVPLKKFWIIPLGSNPYLFKFNPEARVQQRNKLGISENDVLLVYSGKIDPSKGIDILIKAMAPIAAKDARLKLLIIGKGDILFVNYLKKLISKYSMDKIVIFYPWVTKDNIPSLYSASDVGVWPGLSSISIVDAASTGLPLIIARYPVESFAIKNGNGLSFEIGNVEELSKCIKTLFYDEKVRKSMGQKSRLLVEDELNWAKISRNYFDAYSFAVNRALKQTEESGVNIQERQNSIEKKLLAV